LRVIQKKKKKKHRRTGTCPGHHAPPSLETHAIASSWFRGGLVFEAHRLYSLRLKDLLGPVTRVKKKEEQHLESQVFCSPRERVSLVDKGIQTPMARGQSGPPNHHDDKVDSDQ